MILTITPRAQTILQRVPAIPAAIRRQIAAAPLIDHAHYLDLTDDDYLILTQQLTLSLRTIKNAKVRRTLDQILTRLTEQNEAQQSLPGPKQNAAGFDPENIRAVIAELERTEPGWADSDFKEMITKLTQRVLFTDEEHARRGINLLMAHHDQLARPMFHGLTATEVDALLANDWTTDSPGLYLRQDDLTPESVQDTLAIKRAVAFVTALGDKGTAATTKGNLNRKFVGAMLDRLEIPTSELEGIRTYNTVINEEDVFTLHELHVWLKIAKLVRPYRGRIVALKRTRKIVAQADWPVLYTALFRTVFQVYDLAYRDRMNIGRDFQPTLAYSLHQLARLESGWHDISASHARLILPQVTVQLSDLPFWCSARRLVERRLLEPLAIFGLVELKRSDPTPGDHGYRELVGFRRTELFEAFFGVRWE